MSEQMNGWIVPNSSTNVDNPGAKLPSQTLDLLDYYWPDPEDDDLYDWRDGEPVDA